MVINTKELKEACSKILLTIDNNSTSSFNGMLEFITENNILYFNMTNKEYFAKIKLGECDSDFHATISADKFLKLISQCTTDDIELNVTDTFLKIKSNGNYTFPLIYADTQVLTLPKIEIKNPTVNFKINSSILNSIRINNSKEIAKITKGKTVPHPTQKMYYMDEQGAITYYKCACINKFTLDKPVKVLFNSNFVKLFALFKNTDVDFTLGYDALSDEIIQTKVAFKTDDIELTAILNCDDSLLKAIPAQAIRGRATNEYPYSITVNRADLSAAIQRLLLFVDDINGNTTGYFKFSNSSCTVSDSVNANTETIKYANELSSDMTYEAMLNLTDLKLALDNSTDEFITISFGDHKAFVVAKDNIYTVIPETTVR